MRFACSREWLRASWTIAAKNRHANIKTIVSARVNLNNENRPVILCFLQGNSDIHFKIDQESELAVPQKTSDYFSIANLSPIIN
jgi:hypothetical protein